MLSARYLAGCTDDIVKLYSQLEADIIKDMARRMLKVSRVTDADVHQVEIIKQIGGLQNDIKNYLTKYNATAQKQVIELYEEAVQKATENDVKYYAAAMRSLSDNQKQVLNATAGKLSGVGIVNSNKKVRQDVADGKAIKMFSGLERLTMTIADSAAGAFVQQANSAYMQVATGAADYNSAYKNAVDTLAASGVRTVEYTDSGHLIKRSIESAVRTNIMTGLNQTASQITRDNCADLGTQLVEVSAHLGARPDHAAWQGKIYSLAGEVYDADGKIKYEDFYKVCRPGEPDGIGGINCRHSYYPYFEGMPPQYSDGELDEMKDNLIDYNGEKITQYEAEQQMRLYERGIRKWKTRADAENEMGLDNTAARRKLGEWQERAQKFSQATGIKRDYAREYIGTASGVQPKAISEAKYNYGKNAKLASEIKRLDNSRKKEVAGITAGDVMTFEQADHKQPNPLFKRAPGYDTNCQSCVVVYELRRRGYDLETMPNLNGSMCDVLSGNTSLAWVDRTTGKNPKYIYPNGKTLKNKIQWLEENLNPNERHTIQWQWRGGSGHIINTWKNNDGKINMYDPQTGAKLETFEEIKRYLDGCKVYSLSLMNISNCDINLNVVNGIARAKK